MKKQFGEQKYVVISVVCHVLVLLAFVLGLDQTSQLAVIENTNQHDVISAVVLGDTAKSKILPQQIDAPKPKPVVEPKEEPKPAPPPEKPKVEPIAKKEPEVTEKDVIALKAAEKKKLEDQKKLEEEKKLADKKRKDKLADDLLADIEKINEKQKKDKQKELQNRFQKMLQEQAEKSLRQNLLNEEVKLKGTQNRQAQGEVNKYKALILQAISEHWIIPTQSNKKLYCELMIRIAPGGTVLDVQITKTSGDPALDSSARAAVLKSSPLPVPNTPDAFEPFRQFVLKVKPENVMG